MTPPKPDATDLLNRLDPECVIVYEWDEAIKTINKFLDERAPADDKAVREAIRATWLQAAEWVDSHPRRWKADLTQDFKDNAAALSVTAEKQEKI